MNKTFKIKTEKIISLIESRDQKGISALYDQYSGALLGVIIRIVKNKELAEEILQKTFLKVWEKISSYDSNKSNLFTWIVSIARNTAIDHVRLKGFSNLQKTDSLDTSVYDINTTNIETDGIDVKMLLSKLDEKYKIVLDMMYLQGYSQSEISKKLDIPLGTVKTRAKAAIKILRQELINEKNLFFGILFNLILFFSLI